MSDYNAERIGDIEGIIGKVPVEVNHEEMNAVFIRFDDGSFLYGEVEEAYDGIIRFNRTISTDEMFRLGIASEQIVERRKKMEAISAAYAIKDRRKLYEELRKEFEEKDQ